MKKSILAVVVLVALTISLSSASAVTEAEIEASIEAGLVWLAAQQVVMADDDSLGYWPGSYLVGVTGIVVKKFEHYAIEHKIPPLDPDYRFYDQVKYGLNYIFSQAIKQDLVGANAIYDSDGDGFGICFGASKRAYETGIALMAIAESNCPDSIVDIPGNGIPEVNGKTYREVAVDIMDYLDYHQYKSAPYTGGWGYTFGHIPDQSVTGYVVLGFAYAEAGPPHGFNLTVPAAVKNRLNTWANYIQCTTAGTDFGGSGYTSPCNWVNCLKTGNLLFELALLDRFTPDPAVNNAVQYLVNHWDDPNTDPGWQNHTQAAYCIMKGLEFQGITGNLPNYVPAMDWYDSLASHLVHTQVMPAGNWPGDPWGGSELSTAWALLTLERAAPSAGPKIKIEKTHDTYQGCYEYVSITIEGYALEMGGFDFLVAYDASALTFMEATPGQLLEDCGWEYFTYRYGWQGNCEGPCPSGLLRIVAIAEINNGPNHPACFGPPDTDPHELAEMKFYVTHDYTFECMYVPIRFFWHDCGDNAISSVTGDTLWISDQVYDFEGNEVTGAIHYGGHWWLDGPPFPVQVPNDACMNPDTSKPDPIPYLDFVWGGIDIICIDSIDARGDINLNDVPNEIADAVLFTNYFIYGYGVFDINPAGQVAATDVNNDGRVLTVGDLVYLIRIVVGDALPFPKLSPYAHSVEVLPGDVVMTRSDVDIGAGLFVFDGKGTAELLADGMKMLSDVVDGQLRVLVWSDNTGRIPAGEREVISVTGDVNLIETSFSDYNGNMMNVDVAKITPNLFALHQNYPNPFNPLTDITIHLPEEMDWKLEIFNIMGQMVESFSGRDVGEVTVTWDATAKASGIYFYKATAGDYTDTRKMVLMK